MKRVVVVVLAALCLAASLSAFAQKPRIAVLKIKNDSTAGGGRLGPAIQDWLMDELVKSGKFRVMERKRLNAVFAEQGLSMSGAVDDKTAVAVGKLLGCQLVVLGAVTDFSRHRSGAHGAFGIGFGVKKTTAEGTLNIRLVNTTTGEIIYTGSAKGKHSFSKVSVAGFGGGVDWDESQFRQIFEPAVKQLVGEMTAKVDSIKEDLGKIAVFSGKVAKVEEGKIYVNIGSTDGIKEGTKLKVYHVGETITDPDTGKVLGQEKSRIGTATITRVMGDHLSVAVMDGGTATVTVGDIVEP